MQAELTSLGQQLVEVLTLPESDEAGEDGVEETRALLAQLQLEAPAADGADNGDAAASSPMAALLSGYRSTFNSFRHMLGDVLHLEAK